MLDPTSERWQFLRGIADDPDNNDRRSIYADWLDENGEPDHAEWIRCDVMAFNERREHEKVGHCDGRCGMMERARALEARGNKVKRHLLNKIHDDGGIPFPGMPHVDDRGFIVSVRGRPEAIVSSLPVILDAHPVHTVRLESLDHLDEQMKCVRLNGWVKNVEMPRSQEPGIYTSWFANDPAASTIDWHTDPPNLTMGGIRFTFFEDRPNLISAQWATASTNIRENLNAIRDRILRDA